MELSTSLINRYVAPAAGLVFFLLGLPAFIFWGVYFDTLEMQDWNFGAFANVPGDLVKTLMAFTHSYKGIGGLSAEALDRLAVTVPALLTGVALRPNQDRISLTQKISVLLLSVSFLASLLIVIFIDLNSDSIRSVFENSETVLPKLVDGATQSLDRTVIYLLFVLGLNTSIVGSSVPVVNGGHNAG